MASKLNSSSDCGVFLNTIVTSATTFTKAPKRWRIAYSAIYFALYIAKDTEAEKRIKAQISSKEMAPSLRSNVFFPNHVILDGVDENTHLVQIEKGDDSCFPSIDRSKLAEMVKEKALNALPGVGGVEGLTKALDTGPENGIHGDEHDVRLRAEHDITILILLGCAALSLGFGIKEKGAGQGWYEGGSIFVAVFLVVTVFAISNFRQARQFDKLSKISSNIKIDVAGDGRRQKISIFDIVVGDVVFLMIGDQIPADGLFLRGHSLLVDESSVTGESIPICNFDKEL
ncbi:hypothetical protein ACSBR2_039806 [Camellia fascicularis]